MRRALLGLLCLAPLAGAGVATPAALATCQAAQLAGAEYESNGAVGTVVVSITLTNKGAPCTLRGYAGLRLARASGPLPTTVVHGGHSAVSQPVRLVSLARGGRATILIAYSHVPTGTEKCPTATKLLVRPPGASGWVNVAVGLDPCGRGTIRESPILSGVRHAP